MLQLCSACIEWLALPFRHGASRRCSLLWEGFDTALLTSLPSALDKERGKQVPVELARSARWSSSVPFAKLRGAGCSWHLRPSGCKAGCCCWAGDCRVASSVEEPVARSKAVPVKALCAGRWRMSFRRGVHDFHRTGTQYCDCPLPARLDQLSETLAAGSRSVENPICALLATCLSRSSPPQSKALLHKTSKTQPRIHYKYFAFRVADFTECRSMSQLWGIGVIARRCRGLRTRDRKALARKRTDATPAARPA